MKIFKTFYKPQTATLLKETIHARACFKWYCKRSEVSVLASEIRSALNMF